MTTVSDTRGVSGTAETACRLLESLWDAGQRPDVGQLVTESSSLEDVFLELTSEPRS